MRELLAKPFYRLSHRFARIGWWVAEPRWRAREERRAKAAEAARIDGSIAPEGSDG